MRRNLRRLRHMPCMYLFSLMCTFVFMLWGSVLSILNVFTGPHVLGLWEIPVYYASGLLFSGSSIVATGLGYLLVSGTRSEWRDSLLRLEHADANTIKLFSKVHNRWAELEDHWEMDWGSEYHETYLVERPPEPKLAYSWLGTPKVMFRGKGQRIYRQITTDTEQE